MTEFHLQADITFEAENQGEALRKLSVLFKHLWAEIEPDLGYKGLLELTGDHKYRFEKR